jgi:hypothetical protein
MRSSFPTEWVITVLVFLLILFLIAAYFITPNFTDDQAGIIYFLMAVLAGVVTYFISGSASITGEIEVPFFARLGISGAAGLGLFLITYLVSPRIVQPRADDTPTATPIPAVVLSPTPAATAASSIVTISPTSPAATATPTRGTARQTETVRMQSGRPGIRPLTLFPDFVITVNEIFIGTVRHVTFTASAAGVSEKFENVPLGASRSIDTPSGEFTIVVESFEPSPFSAESHIVELAIGGNR